MLFPVTISFVGGVLGFGLIRFARGCLEEDYKDYDPLMGVLALYGVGFLFIVSGCVVAGSSVPEGTALGAKILAAVGPQVLVALAILYIPAHLATKRKPKKKKHLRQQK